MTTATADAPDFHPINRPRAYNAHPSGIQCVEISERLGANLSQAFQYVWRAPFKHESPLDDLQKALWFIRRERDHGLHIAPHGVTDTFGLILRVIGAEPRIARAAALDCIWQAAAHPSKRAYDDAERAVIMLIREAGGQP